MSSAFLRPTVVAGNWKMYKTIAQAKNFVETLAPLVKKSQAAIYLSVPFTAIQAVVQRLKELQSSIVIGAQNMNDASEGAFTGEVAAMMLKEAGAQFVVIGHSERRRLFQEDDALINRKLKKALSEKIQPILCIGETLQERENGQVEEVIERQLQECLKGVLPADLTTVIVAYEPVWAIGTGKVATPQEVQQAHGFCRQMIAQIDAEAAQKVVIQYGGSVKPENAAELIALEDVDGFLVGGASLNPDEFNKIITQVNTYLKNL